MVDVHCHILPGIDDGAADIQESLAQIERGETVDAATFHAEIRARFERK